MFIAVTHCTTTSKESACRMICILRQQTSEKRWFANVNVTSNFDVPNSVYPVTMTTIRHCSMLEFVSGANNQAVAPGITSPLHATRQQLCTNGKSLALLYAFNVIVNLTDKEGMWGKTYHFFYNRLSCFCRLSFRRWNRQIPSWNIWIVCCFVSYNLNEKQHSSKCCFFTRMRITLHLLTAPSVYWTLHLEIQIVIPIDNRSFIATLMQYSLPLRIVHFRSSFTDINASFNTWYLFFFYCISIPAC